MRRFIPLTILLAIAVFARPAHADPSSSPFEILNEKLDTIQQSLDNQVLPLVEETEPRIPISNLPFTVDTPGSYYLTGDLTSSGDGIIITVDNVTIDLMGFTINGPDSGTTYGIYSEGPSNVEIRNGTIRNFGSHGIYQGGGNGYGHRVVSVRVISNGGDGIHMVAYAHLAKNCTVVGNNGNYGVLIGNGSIVTSNTVHSNRGRGISAGYSCAVRNNISYDNTGYGIYTGGGSTIIDNVSRENGDRGISVDAACTLIGNTVHTNARSGIYTERGCSVINNTVRNNNQSSIGGIPTEGGITTREQCLIKGNTSTYNGYQNIYVAQSDSVIEENVVLGSSKGIYFESGGNFYANNRASGNTTDYANTAGNTDGGGNYSF